MTANDNETNLVKFKKKQKKVEPSKPQPKRGPLVQVFLRDRDVCLHFLVPDYTLVLRPNAAYDLALLLLKAIKAGALRYLPKEDRPNDET